MGKCCDWSHVLVDREAQMRKILLSLIQLEESRVATTNTLAKQIKHCEEAVSGLAEVTLEMNFEA